MASELSADQIEIINEFLQESRDMLDNLEPTIIELGQSCQNADCWTTMGCTRSECLHYGRQLDLPCWLHAGHIGGDQSCPYASSEQECRSCRVFTLVNGDSGTMNAIFRLFHSMKGSAGFLEMENISHVAHAAESLLDLIRSGKIRMEPGHVNLLCQACDFARSAMEYVESHFEDKGMGGQGEEVTARLKEAIEAAQERVRTAREHAQQGSAPVAETAGTSRTETAEIPFQLLITPEMTEKFVQEADELLQSAEQALLSWAEAPAEQEVLPALFRDIHSFKGNCGFLGYGELERLSHLMETVLDAAKSGAPLNTSMAAERLLQMVDVLREGIAAISRGEGGEVRGLSDHLALLQDLLRTPPAPAEAEPPAPMVTSSPPSVPPTAPATKARGPVPVRPTAPPVVSPESKAAEARQKEGPGSAVKRQDIRVDLEKLDHLINIIGEMVIAENMLIHNPDLAGLELESFNRSAQQMSKIVRELQELAMNIRMIPVSGLFRRMIRLVHDLSVKFGKKVDLQLAGEETEMDKTVIETITDPLVHLIRNSLDHGLEPPDERLKAGKTEKGTIRLSARHEEGEVWITIEDDGRGLNREKILAKAAAKGLIEGDGSDLSDKAVANLIFMPGFSTADKVTDVSGRGVGMDVVKQNLEKIKGKIEVQSTPGHGTRLHLRIPLTLGIIDGMMVRVGDAKCIVPTLAIREAFRPQAGAITVTPGGDELVRVRENFFSVIRLHDVLKKEPESRDLPEGILIVLEYQENRCCLFVDEILGQQQTVIKGLSDYIGNVRWVSGCTILGDGEVCLILDVGSLVDMVEQRAAAVG